jgi:hypothetical protein
MEQHIGFIYEKNNTLARILNGIIGLHLGDSTIPSVFIIPYNDESAFLIDNISEFNLKVDDIVNDYKFFNITAMNITMDDPIDNDLLTNLLIKNYITPNKTNVFEPKIITYFGDFDTSLEYSTNKESIVRPLMSCEDELIDHIQSLLTCVNCRNDLLHAWAHLNCLISGNIRIITT